MRGATEGPRFRCGFGVWFVSARRLRRSMGRRAIRGTASAMAAMVTLLVGVAIVAIVTMACYRKARPGDARTKADSQAVLVYLDGVGLPQEIYDKYDLQGLEDRIEPVLRGKHAGEFDGEEVRQTETVLFFYGADAEVLFAAIEPELRAYPLCVGARVVIRKGPPGSPAREVHLPR